MRTKPLTINLEVEQIERLDKATTVLDVSRSKLISTLLRESMIKLNNYLDIDTRNFYIFQFVKGKIGEEVLFDVFHRENALEIIEGVKVGKMGARKAIEMLSSV